MNDFEQLGLNHEILKTLQALDFTTPTAVQAEAIPQILGTNNDLIILSQTGSGKTATFGLPMVQSFDNTKKKIQFLILTPTRELAKQVSQELKDYSANTGSFIIANILGGEDVQKQIQSIRSQPTVIVGTPGRVLELLNRKILDLSEIDTLVLDEADRMLEMGFSEELNAIIQFLNPDKRTLLFSATMNRQVENLASSQYMINPQKIVIGKQNKSNIDITHDYYLCSAKLKPDVLMRILDYYPEFYGIVFCRTKQISEDLTKILQRKNYSAEIFNSDLSQSDRSRVINSFKNKKTTVLIATDLASRGLDVKNLTHVVNFSLPDNTEDYIHRSGRTARIGKKGICLSIISQREKKALNFLQQKLNISIVEQKIPTGEQVCQHNLLQLKRKIESFQLPPEFEGYVQGIYDSFNEFSKEELICSFVGSHLADLWERYHKIPDLNISEKVNFDMLKINLGSDDDFLLSDLFSLMKSAQKNTKLGKIKIKRKETDVEVDAQFSDKIVKSLNSKKFAHLPIKAWKTVHKKRNKKGRNFS